MGSLSPVLLYFIGTASSTFSAILYWIAIENFQPIELKQKKHQKLLLVGLLSLLISPGGVWIVSLFVRMRNLASTLKETNKI